MNKISITSFLLILCIRSCLSDLRFALEFFRHGARGPIFTNSNNLDLFGEEWLAPGELTAFGMRQHYLLGRRNADRYKNFLSPEFKQNEVYAVSTNYNRTIMSAQSQLQGIFPPGSGLNLTDPINNAVPPVKFNFTQDQAKLGDAALPNFMNVFPVHVFEYSSKMHYLYDPKVCPTAATVVSKRKRNSNVIEFLEKFKIIWGTQLSHLLNKTDINDFDYDQIHLICDTFIADYFNERNLTKLRELGVDPQAFYNSCLEGLKLDVLDVYSGDQELAVVSKSPLFAELDEWMKNRISFDVQEKSYEGYNSPKLVLFSGHDRDLADIQTFLEVVFNFKNKVYPTFASSMLFELYRRDNISDYSKANSDDYFVTITFNDQKFFNLTFPEFHSKVVNKIYSDEAIAKFCNWPLNNKDQKDYDYFMIATLVLSIVAFIELVVIIFQFKKQQKAKPIYNEL